ISEYQSAVTINSLRDKIDRSIKRAQALFMDKRYEDAKDEWEWVNGIDSRNLEARKGLALVKQKLEIQQSIVLATGYLAEGLYRKSVEEWSKVLNVEPDNARALKYLKKAEKLLVIEQKDNEAAAAYKNRKYRKASKIWSLLLEENPSHSERHKWVQFISEIEEKRKAIDPASIASLHLEALTFFDDKEYGKAIAKWEEILSLDVEDEQAQRKIQEARVRIELAMEIEALTVKARTLDKEGKYESSVEEWERIIEKDPLNKQALIGIRDAEEKLAKQRREASLIADAQTLFNEEKFNEAITKWKMILFADKDNKRAKEGIKIAERVLQIKRMNARGDRFFDEKEYQDAIEMWQQVLDIDAQNEHAIKKLAEFEKVYKIDTLTVSAKELLEEGEYEKAIDEWNKILEIEPDNKDAKEEIKAALTQIKAGRLHVIASGFYTDKDYPGALRTLKEILVIDPANIQAARSIEEIEELLKNQEITRLFNRVNDLDQEGKFAEATTVLKRILEIDPVNFDAKQQMERIKAKQTVLIQKQQTVKTLFSKAEELQKNGWYEDAIGQWRLVLELEPENKDALQSIHKTEKKLEVIASALVKASDYLKQGEYKNAIGEWREVLKLDDLNQKALEGIEDASTRLKLYERIAGLHSRAETFFKGKNYRSALDEWEKILTLDPANGKALAGSKEAQRLFEIEQLNKKAGGYFSQKQYSKAREEWEKVFGFDPANLSAKKGLEEVQRIEKEIEILRADAARFMKEGKYKEAIDQWRLVLGEEPDNQEALQNLPDAEKGYSISTYISNASDYLKGGKYQLAIEEWEKVLDLDDKKRQAREGIERASKQLQLNEKIVGLNTRADTFSKDKNYQEAIALWNKVLTLDPANGKALTGSKGAQKLLEIKQLNEKAEGNFSHKHYSKAREEWQKVLVFDPANLSAKKGLEEVQRIEKRIGVLREEAVRFMKEGRYKEAIDKWRLVLGVDPDNQEALQNIPETEKKLTIITSSLSKGSNYFKQKEYQNAIKEWEKVLDLDSQNLQAGEGIEKASRQLKIKMQVEGLLSSADSAFESERYQFAITEWNKVLTLDPENAKALAGSKDVQRLMDIGKLHEKAGGYLSQKQYSKAREEWQKVLEEDPANLKAKRGIEETQRIEKEIGELSADAARLMKEERYSDAIDQWRQVLEKDPDNHVALRYIPEAEKRQAINNHLSRASDYLKREDFQHAIKEWEKVLDVDSQNRQARKGIEESNNQWYLKLQVDGLLARAENAFNDKDYQTAIARWNKVLILDPENVKALAGSKDAQKLFEIEKFNTKAGEYFSQKQYHEAIAEWQKTLEVEPANLKAIKGIEEAQKIEKEILALRADAEKLAIQEKHEEAGVKWHELLVLLPGDKKAIKGLEDAKKHGRIKMLNLQSIEFLESGKFKAAIEKCEEILQLESGNVRAKEGIRKARSGIEKRRKIGLFYDSGTKLFASGKYSEAIAEWQKILVWEPDNPKAKEGIQNARDAESRLRKKRRAITSFHTDAEKAVKAGDFLIAISHWDKLLELEPDNQNALKGIESAKKRLELVKQIDALHAKADNFFKQGKYQDALSQWKLVMVLDSHDEKALEGIRKAEVERMGALNILASDRYKEGEFEKAIELWAKVLELNPRDQKAEADIQKARNAIIQAAEIEKLNTKAAELLAQKRFREAMVHWKRVLELDPENKPGIAGIKSAQTQKARHIRELKASSLKLFEENRFEDSIKGWQEILSIAPDDPVALSQLNKTQAAHEKHRRSEENRSVVKHLLVKADEYFNRQRYTIPPKDNAFNIYKEVLKLDTENEKAKNGIIRIGQEYKKRGDKAFKEHDYSRAKGFYERILLVQSESKEGKELLEKAEKALNKQKQIDAWNAQATGLFQSGKLTTAQEIWQKVLAEDPVNDEANRGLVLINDKWLDKSLGKATQYFKDGKYEDAILTWKEILVRDSKNRDSQEGIIVAEQIKGLRSQAISLFTSGNFQKSLEKWKNILDLNPGNSEALSGVKKASAKIAIPTDIVKAMRGGDASNAFDWMDKGGDVNAKSTGGMTLLMVAAWNGHTDIIHSLISKGADVNAKNGKGETALMLSSLYGLENVVKSLLDNNAEVNAKNVSGDTALLRATLAGYGDIVKLLMERGANLNTKNKNGDNALIVAAKMGHTDTVSVLLGGGVSVNAQNAHGNTALIVAAEKGRTDTVEELLKGGAAPDYVNGRGESALSIATKKNHRKIIKLLKRTGAKR
ncbi:MAG: hypothetical protein GY941_01940, partial [Planctomycetes bacterium]|nr:hypothetical protein [Planctomycetota bacterium]